MAGFLHMGMGPEENLSRESGDEYCMIASDVMKGCVSDSNRGNCLVFVVSFFIFSRTPALLSEVFYHGFHTQPMSFLL